MLVIAIPCYNTSVFDGSKHLRQNTCTTLLARGINSIVTNLGLDATNVSNVSTSSLAILCLSLLISWGVKPLYRHPSPVAAGVGKVVESSADELKIEESVLCKKLIEQNLISFLH